jgi:glycosyltransferase involved in cell wall biosynthesis/aminoglycoside phosphotransferase (APT) family kinase protein
LITGTPTVLGGGNVDRHPLRARSAWRARLPDGTEAKLTVAADLRAEAARAGEFAGISGGLGPAVRFHRRAADTEVLALEFVPGESLDALLQTSAARTMPAIVGLKRLAAALRATTTASDLGSREAEWQAWTKQLLELPVWNDAARVFLADSVLPRLRDATFAAAPARTWVHGDLIGRNLLVAAGGQVRLIDPEFATATHFPESEFARFFALTPGASRLAAQLLPEVPTPTPAAELQFWLQQIEREVRFNRDEYVARWLPHRLGEVRRLTEQLAGVPLPSWPWAAATSVHGDTDASGIDHAIEAARWLIDDPEHAVLLAGWCCPTAGGTDITAVAAQVGGHDVAVVPMRPRPDVQAHFGGRPNTLHTGFEVRLPSVAPNARIELVARLGNGPARRFWSGLAGSLPGRGPVLCAYRSWAELLDPEPIVATRPDQAFTFSVLVPIHDPPPAFLRSCLDSVRMQSYSGWELCLVDDASTDPQVRATLQEYAAADDRIRVSYAATNGGIARTTNAALQAATGEFAVFLDHDDVLRPFALAEIAARLRSEPDLDVVYSDEDKIDPEGRQVVPMFKPDFSPEYLRGVMYVGHVLCVRRMVALRAGGFDPSYDGVQDYEFMLRVSERTKRIGHIPRVLYHWRQSAGSSALVGNVKGDMDARQLAAVQAHLRRIGDARSAVAGGGHRVLLRGPANDQTSAPDVPVVTWTPDADPLDALRRAASESTAAVLLLAEAGAVAVTPAVVLPLATLALRSDSGCVAPVLLSSPTTVDESGGVFGADGPQPVMQGFDAAGDGFNGSLRCNREVDAVSPRCVAVRREIAAVHAALAASWVDFLRRVRRAGCYHRVAADCRVVVTAPGGGGEPARSGRELSRGETPPVNEFYNPHFANEPADYRLARRPPQLERSRTPFVFRLESVIDDAAQDGWLELRGWCFHLEGAPVQLHLRCGALEWRIAVAEPRPDVAAAYPVFAGPRAGFSQRIGLPGGAHELVVEAAAGAERQIVLQRRLRVSRFAEWHRWRSSPPARRLAFQLSASPSHAPRPLQAERWPQTGDRAGGLRLSVVTPSFEQARFLPHTLEGVLAQGVGCEYVVQDGGSTDGSRAILEAQGARLSSWASARDDGQSAAIAQGFRRTSGGPGDLMAWINSDDFYLPGALRYVLAYFAAHPEVDVAYGHRVLVDETGREIGRWFLPPHDEGVLRLNDFIPQETLFWRRRLWDRVGGIDPTFKFAMDWDLLLRFAAAGARIVRLPYFLAAFRVHPAQKTSSQLNSVGQAEIDALRQRTFGRRLTPAEIEQDPGLIRYLRTSARLEFLWRRFGVRGK